MAWSNLTAADFADAYWRGLYQWFEDGGYGHVAAYLAQQDLAGFDPKAPPPKTAAFWEIVDANRAPEESELADAIDKLAKDDKPPEVITLAQLSGVIHGELALWLVDRRNSRQIPHRLAAVGYVPVRNDAAKDGLWKIGDKRQVVYGRATLTLRDRVWAARQWVEAQGKRRK